jgi:hypothetical protein
LKAVGETITRDELIKKLNTTRDVFRGITKRGTGPKAITPPKQAPVVYLVSEIEEWLNGKGKRFYSAWHGQGHGSTRHLVPAELLDDYDKMAEIVKPWEKFCEVQEKPVKGWASGCWIWRGFYLYGLPKYSNRMVRPTVFRTVFPDAEFKTVTNQCGTEGCVNPDHLVDTTLAFWENIEFLMEQGVRPTKICDRLGVTYTEVGNRLSKNRTEERQAIFDRFSLLYDSETGNGKYNPDVEQEAA